MLPYYPRAYIFICTVNKTWKKYAFIKQWVILHMVMQWIKTLYLGKDRMLYMLLHSISQYYPLHCTMVCI
jgi:hypothetical protein